MSSSSRKWIKFVNYILDYGPIIVTVIVATIASLSTTRSSVTSDEMLQWALVVLALLATTQLVDRFRLMRNLESKVEHILESAGHSSGANAFFTRQIPYMTDRLLRAKTISINGITLSRTSDSLWGTFKQKIAEGARIRVLVIDPDHPVLDVAANLFQKHQDPSRLRREIEHALDNFASLMTDSIRSEAFQVRLLPCIPPYGIWLIDVDTPQAEIWVEVYPFRSEQQPAFHLLPHRDGEWFAFFQRQFEIMWSASREWHPKRNNTA
ncbi:MAG: hypothetical protein QXP01_07355 [Candidatus Hadarchaeum sp.]